MVYGVKDANKIQILLFAMAILTIPAITVTLNGAIYEKLTGRLYYVLFALVLFVWFIWNYRLHLEAKVYVIALTIGVILHQLSNIEVEENVNGTLFTRLVPVILMSMYMRVDRNLKWLMVFMMAFYLVECLMCFYERMTLTHIFSYTLGGREDAYNINMSGLEENKYRATALMAHPLFNANTISVAMAFILCSDKIKPLIKIALWAIGLLGLYGCNSRGVFLVWAVILLYRFTLYNRKWWLALIAILALYFLVPIFLDWLLVSGLLGRMEGFDFSDSSTNTRIIAWYVFSNARWTFEDIVIGGRFITYMGSKTTLENGVLLDLSYWGLIIGPIKIITEVLLTWHACHHFPLRAKVIIMLATWGVAFMNNNSCQTWLLPMFVLFCIGFAPFQTKEAKQVEETYTPSPHPTPSPRDSELAQALP